jgi:glutamyl-tRNA synthetase
LAAWLFAKKDGGRFLLRFEDLDTASVRHQHYQSQADDLAALELDWDETPIRQSDRLDVYRDAIRQLTDQDLVYPCYCSRKDVREATQAPNGLYRTRHYPGTCRTLTAAQRAERVATGRRPALRFRSDGERRSFTDLVAGPFSSQLDDFVVQRGDGTPAYNLAATVDDAAQGVDLVVRADDLLDSTPRQLVLLETLGLPTPTHAHVPLVLNEVGDRLAKRDGAVTLEDRMALGQSTLEVRSILAASLGLCATDEQPTLSELLERFDPAALPRTPWSIPGASIEADHLGLD